MAEPSRARVTLADEPGAAAPPQSPTFADLRNVGSEPKQIVKAPEDELSHSFRLRDNLTGREGDFLSVIPSVATQVEIGLARGRAARGVPWACIPEDDRALIDAIVLSTYCLARHPDWYDEPMKAQNPRVILEVGQEVLRHHARWFRSVAAACERNAPGRGIVEITPLVGGTVQPAVAR